MSRLLEEYNNQIKKELKSKLGFKNLFEVPKLLKIIVNTTTIKINCSDNKMKRYIIDIFMSTNTFNQI